MNLVFDRTAGVRTLKFLTDVDVSIHECVTLIPRQRMGAAVDAPCRSGGGWAVLPRIICRVNGPEFVGKALFTWAHDRNVNLRQIDLVKPNRNFYTELFNGSIRETNV